MFADVITAAAKALFIILAGASLMALSLGLLVPIAGEQLGFILSFVLTVFFVVYSAKTFMEG